MSATVATLTAVDADDVDASVADEVDPVKGRRLGHLADA